GCWVRRSSARCGDDRYPPSHQIGRQFGQPVVFILRPAIFDCRVVALDVASLAEPLRKAANRFDITLAEPVARYPITGIAGCCARAASGNAAAAPPSSVMKSRLFIDRIASDPPSRECMTEYRIGKDQFNVTDEGIIFLREVTLVSTWTEDDKRIATRALKTLEEASVASRGA